MNMTNDELNDQMEIMEKGFDLAFTMVEKRIPRTAALLARTVKELEANGFTRGEAIVIVSRQGFGGTK